MTNKTSGDNTKTGSEEEVHNAGQMPQMPLFIHSQYIKDLSFENPKAPNSFRNQERPVMDVSFSMNARGLGDQDEAERDTFEVVLGAEIRAMREDEVVFLIELQYGAVVSLKEMPEGKKHPMLLIEVPRFLFPFVRQIVADLTSQAGYAPLLLTPVNFKSLYMKQFGIKGGQGKNAAKTA